MVVKFHHSGSQTKPRISSVLSISVDLYVALLLTALLLAAYAWWLVKETVNNKCHQSRTLDKIMWNSQIQKPACSLKLTIDKQVCLLKLSRWKQARNSRSKCATDLVRLAKHHQVGLIRLKIMKCPQTVLKFLRWTNKHRKLFFSSSNCQQGQTQG